MVAVAAKKRPASAPAKTLKATRAKSATKPTNKSATSHRVRASDDMVVVDKGKRPADERAIEESRAAKVPRTGEHGMAPTSSSAGAGPSSAPPAEFARGAPPRPEEFARPAMSQAVLPEVEQLVHGHSMWRNLVLGNIEAAVNRVDVAKVLRNSTNARNALVQKFNTMPLNQASFVVLNAAIDGVDEIIRSLGDKQKRMNWKPTPINRIEKTRTMPPADPVAVPPRPDPTPPSKPKEPKGGSLKSIVPTRDGSAIVMKPTRFDPDFWKEFVPLTKDLIAANEKSYKDIMETPGISDAEKRERIKKLMLADNASVRATILRPALNALQRSVESRAESESVPRRENYTRVDAGISSNAGGGAFLPARIRESHRRPQDLLKATYQPFSEQAQKVIKELYGPENRPFAIHDPLLESLVTGDEAKKRVDARAAKRRAINAGVLASHADAAEEERKRKDKETVDRMRELLRTGAGPSTATGWEALGPELRKRVWDTVWASKPRLDELKGALLANKEFKRAFDAYVKDEEGPRMTENFAKEAASKFYGALETRQNALNVKRDVGLARGFAEEQDRKGAERQAEVEREVRRMAEREAAEVEMANRWKQEWRWKRENDRRKNLNALRLKLHLPLVPYSEGLPPFQYNSLLRVHDQSEESHQKYPYSLPVVFHRPGAGSRPPYVKDPTREEEDPRDTGLIDEEPVYESDRAARNERYENWRVVNGRVDPSFFKELDDTEKAAKEKLRAAELVAETAKRDLAGRSVDLERLKGPEYAKSAMKPTDWKRIDETSLSLGDVYSTGDDIAVPGIFRRMYPDGPAGNFVLDHYVEDDDEVIMNPRFEQAMEMYSSLAPGETAKTLDEHMKGMSTDEKRRILDALLERKNAYFEQYHRNELEAMQEDERSATKARVKRDEIEWKRKKEKIENEEKGRDMASTGGDTVSASAGSAVGVANRPRRGRPKRR
eukprot:jgi/Mesvir1/11141/Mv04583-RA.1